MSTCFKGLQQPFLLGNLERLMVTGLPWSIKLKGVSVYHICDICFFAGWICYSHLFHLLPDTVLCAGLFYLHKQHWLHQWVDDIIDRISRTEIGNDQVLYLTGKEMISVDEQGLSGLPKDQDLLSAFDTDASLDVLDHPVLNLIYYMLVEILPSALVLYILRKLPPKRISAQYHPIR
ncbi:hypothetical protein Patl1_11094 [Pistacia atlantica]|uniref:Uncharacterized protein n=1 Tax=Pistacia atlantica TaxID=434234 RepID=A0ACC1AA48_9ROSI|nr:hypothetical protein Patl1_11094 [Pistacia atlantica]